MKNSRREILLAALLTYPTIREAAGATGISESTIYAWLKKDDFKAELERRRGELVIDTKNHLQSRLREVTDTILDIMSDKDTPPQTRLNAASEAFRNTMKLIDTADIINRLDALEAATREDNNR